MVQAAEKLEYDRELKMQEKRASIRVVIVDDHQMVRLGLSMMLKMGEGFELVGEAGDGTEALPLIGELQPDVVLMDLRMPHMDGLDAIAQIREQWPRIAILILTTYNEDDLVIRGLQAGACGYLLKDTSVETLLHAIQAAARGEILMQPEIVARLLAHAAKEPQGSSNRPRGRNRMELTARELEVLAAVASGKRNKEIARQLGVSERTIWAFLTNIFTKLDVDSRTSAVAVALERGLLPPQR